MFGGETNHKNKKVIDLEPYYLKGIIKKVNHLLSLSFEH
jgi:hypothetical protein